MRALTIWEPYAMAIALGWKPVENRTWPTSHRGPLAIHASKRPPDSDDVDDVLDIVYGPDARFDRADAFSQRKKEFVSLLRPGHVVAVVRVVGMLTEREAHESLKNHKTGSEFFNGPIGWHVDGPVRLREPIAARGAQGLWLLPPEVERQVLAQL